MAAEGSAVITHQDNRTIKKVIWAWTSDVATGAVTGGAGQTSFPVSGEVLRITTDPGATAPDDNYDVVINDEDGVDVACGFLINRDTVTTETVVPRFKLTLTSGGPAMGVPMYVDGKLDLIIAAAGNSKVGTVTLYYR